MTTDLLREDIPPPWLLGTVRGIDRYVGRGSGLLFCWLIIPMVVALTYEVLARYLFHAPTIWAYDTTYMLYGSHFMLGAAYCLLQGGHIRTDIFYGKWSERTKGRVDAALYLLLFFPGMFFFLIRGWDEAYHAWDIGERSDLTPFQPIMWPFKAVIPFTAAMLLIQGVSEFLKAAWAARTGQELFPKTDTPAEML